MYSIQKHEFFRKIFRRVSFFQLHDLLYEILLKPNHLLELFFINIFPLDVLNSERNQ